MGQPSRILISASISCCINSLYSLPGISDCNGALTDSHQPVLTVPAAFKIWTTAMAAAQGGGRLWLLLQLLNGALLALTVCPTVFAQAEQASDAQQPQHWKPWCVLQMCAVPTTPTCQQGLKQTSTAFQR